MTRPTDHASGDLPRPGDPGRPSVPSDYSVGLECEIVTRAGTPMTMRPIVADDSLKLSQFHGLLSPTSVYRRYFYLHPKLSPKEISHLTEVDYVARLAMVVEHDGQLVAVGRCWRPRCLHMSRQGSVHTDRPRSMVTEVLAGG